MAAQQADEEGHGQRLAGAGCVPYDTEPLVGPGAVSLHRLRRGLPHGEKLMVFRGFLGNCFVGYLEHDEVPDVREKPLLREKPLDEGFHRARRARLIVLAVDRLPRRVPFGRRGPYAVASAHTIADDAEGVELEHLRNVYGVVLDLVERLFFGRRNGIRILQLEQDERQTVDVDDDVGTAIVRATDGQLVD